jgi:hypothetical protein
MRDQPRAAVVHDARHYHTEGLNKMTDSGLTRLEENKYHACRCWPPGVASRAHA